MWDTGSPRLEPEGDSDGRLREMEGFVTEDVTDCEEDGSGVPEDD